MKAILVIDIDEKYIGEIGNKIRFFNQTYDCKWKLKPIPQKRILPKEMVDGTNYGEEPWFSDGYNACIDEILGEKQ